MTSDSSHATVFGGGVLEIQPDGHGFLRSADHNYHPSPDDVYVSPLLIATCCAKTGDFVSGTLHPRGQATKHVSLAGVDALNFEPSARACTRVAFDDLKKVDPREQLRMETTRENLCGRVIDLFVPLGKGQRVLITGPIRNGQRLILESIANSIAVNHPEVKTTILLIDKHPEEAIAMKRSLRGEVISSIDEESPAMHARLAELTLERTKRQVEYGHDVVLLLDSITDLFRAYEMLLPPDDVTSSTRDSPALRRIRRFFEAPGATQKAGSLTLVAILDTETGLPFERPLSDAMKSVAHAEMVFDPKVIDDGIFPAVNIHLSKTRNAESLIPKDDLARIWVLRRVLEPLSPTEAVKLVGSKCLVTRSNRHFLANMSAL
jgi:transcription termination factor Rho